MTRVGYVTNVNFDINSHINDVSDVTLPINTSIAKIMLMYRQI